MGEQEEEVSRASFFSRLALPLLYIPTRFLFSAIPWGMMRQTARGRLRQLSTVSWLTLSVEF